MLKYFSASDPEILLKDIQQKEQDLQKILPELKARQKAVKMILKEKENYYTYRFLPKEYFSSTTLTISGNKVVTFVWTRPYYAILVENKEVAESNLATFKYLWKMAESPTKTDQKRRLMKI